MPNQIKRPRANRSSPSGVSKSINTRFQELVKDPVSSGLISALIVAVGVVIIRSIFPGLEADALTLFSVIAGLIFVVLVRLRRSWLLSGFIGLTVFAVLANFFSPKPAQRGGAYIIFDLSQEMQSALSSVDIPSLIDVTAPAVPDNVDVGLMIAGGVFDNTLGECSRALEIIKPGPKSINIPLMEEKISNYSRFIPEGPSNIEYAVLQAIRNLVGRQNVQQIIVITSGVDETCGKLDRNMLRVQASQSGVQFALTVIMIGQQSPSTRKLYQDFADNVEVIDSAAEVQQTISTVVAQPIFSYYSP